MAGKLENMSFGEFQRQVEDYLLQNEMDDTAKGYSIGYLEELHRDGFTTQDAALDLAYEYDTK